MGFNVDVENFQPPSEQLELWPDISGNEINGLGESKSRRPTPIMWHDASMLPHGKVQEYVFAQGVKHPELLAKRKQRTRIIEDFEPAPIAETRIDDSPENNHRAIHEVARAAGAEIVGCVKIDPEWVFDGYEVNEPWMIMLGVPMDHDELNKAPEIEAALEVVDKYTMGWVVGRPVADWIRKRGWQAETHAGPMAGPINMLPAALKCGFGELGKHGSLINRQFGSSFRISIVVTDLPLVEDGPDEFAAEDFCTGCQVCVNACPVDAIDNDKVIVRGTEKWYVDFDKCFKFFAETGGCAICIARCPWSYPGRAPKLAEKWTARRERKRAAAQK